ncbi:DapH/DapD/GlmU-related protein [Nocardioides sp. Leaf307]|uniref:acyltransferase n=1 Tax=Nocardioides sp. Leaf307 TaxID=1736331 RepID=UPI0009EA1571
MQSNNNLPMSFKNEVLSNSLGGSPAISLRLRLWLVRASGVEISTARLYSGVRFYGHRNITLGSDIFLNRGVEIHAASPVRLGARVHVGPGTVFVTSSHELSSDSHQRAGASTTLPIDVGDGTWLGARVTVLGGVTIGRGVVVAAGAVVTGDLADDGIYGGVPARLIRALSPGAP